MNIYRDKKLGIIGAGVSGQGLALLARRLKAKVFVSEQKEIPDDIKKIFEKNKIEFEEGGNTEKIFEGTDEILISSGIPPKAEILHEAESRGIKLTGELDFVIPFVKTRKLICVTGSNGKSTVTSLINHILNKAGFKAGAGGNLGKAAASFTREKFDSVVLELSSFQLARATKNLRALVSIITNLAPDHIDWHGSYENYVAAKAKILQLRHLNGWGIIQERDYEILKPEGKIITLSWNKDSKFQTEGKIFMDADKQEATLILNGEPEKLFDFNQITLLGDHNLENVAMSLSAVKLINSNLLFLTPVESLINGFKPLRHRCELAGVIDGVQYVDDSKGTNVAASATAMKSIKGRKVIILGGQGKGEEYSELADTVKAECDYAVLIGQEAEKIQEALLASGYENFRRASGMEEAVKISHELARPGMVVLLSPACTSWDMYKSYKARGEDFCRLVKELEQQGN